MPEFFMIPAFMVMLGFAIFVLSASFWFAVHAVISCKESIDYYKRWKGDE